LLTVVIPEFKPLFADAGADLPVATRVVVAAGDAFQAYWWAGLAAIIAVYLLFRIQLSRPAARRRWHRILLDVPLFGDLIAKIEIGRFARILGTLLTNGVTVLNALSIAGDVVANSALKHVIREVSESLKQGKGLAVPLESTGLFPALATNLLKVGEETGHLEDMLLKIAEIYDQEVERSTQRMLAILVPAVTIGLGLLIAGIIGSVLAAMLSIYELPL
jgi:general secretion pathway protein F